MGPNELHRTEGTLSKDKFLISARFTIICLWKRSPEGALVSRKLWELRMCCCDDDGCSPVISCLYGALPFHASLHIYALIWVSYQPFERAKACYSHWTVGTTEAQRGWWQTRTQIPWIATHYFFGFWSEVFSQVLIVGRRQHISNDLERGKKEAEKKKPLHVLFS